MEFKDKNAQYDYDHTVHSLTPIHLISDEVLKGLIEYIEEELSKREES